MLGKVFGRRTTSIPPSVPPQGRPLSREEKQFERAMAHLMNEFAGTMLRDQRASGAAGNPRAPHSNERLQAEAVKQQLLEAIDNADFERFKSWAKNGSAMLSRHGAAERLPATLLKALQSAPPGFHRHDIESLGHDSRGFAIRFKDLTDPRCYRASSANLPRIGPQEVETIKAPLKRLVFDLFHRYQNRDAMRSMAPEDAALPTPPASPAPLPRQQRVRFAQSFFRQRAANMPTPAAVDAARGMFNGINGDPLAGMRTVGDLQDQRRGALGKLCDGLRKLAGIERHTPLPDNAEVLPAITAYLRSAAPPEAGRADRALEILTRSLTPSQAGSIADDAGSAGSAGSVIAPPSDVVLPPMDVDAFSDVSFAPSDVVHPPAAHTYWSLPVGRMDDPQIDSHLDRNLPLPSGLSELLSEALHDARQLWGMQDTHASGTPEQRAQEAHAVPNRNRDAAAIPGSGHTGEGRGSDELAQARALFDAHPEIRYHLVNNSRLQQYFHDALAGGNPRVINWMLSRDNLLQEIERIAGNAFIAQDFISMTSPARDESVQSPQRR